MFMLTFMSEEASKHRWKQWLDLVDETELWQTGTRGKQLEIVFAEAGPVDRKYWRKSLEVKKQWYHSLMLYGPLVHTIVSPVKILWWEKFPHLDQNRVKWQFEFK